MPEFSPLVWFLLGLGSAMIVGLFFAWKPLRAGLRAREAAHGISLFRMQRERLEASVESGAGSSAGALPWLTTQRRPRLPGKVARPAKDKIDVRPPF